MSADTALPLFFLVVFILLSIYFLLFVNDFEAGNKLTPEYIQGRVTVLEEQNAALEKRVRELENKREKHND